MRHWSDEKLDRELAFAETAVEVSHEETVKWRDDIKEEIERRAGLRAAGRIL